VEEKMPTINYAITLEWKPKPGEDGMYQAIYDDFAGSEWVNIFKGEICDHNIPVDSMKDFCLWAGPFPFATFPAIEEK
jgi:hypothetical protein